MRGLLTTQSQNCYKEQIQRELLTRLAWKSRYAKLYPSALSLQGKRRQPAPPLMKPVPPPPQSRRAMLQDSSQPQGIGRSLYLQRRGHIRPEEKFDFPLLSSWEYGWRLGKVDGIKSNFIDKSGLFPLLTENNSKG
uniref:Sperm microtubule inner protein 1 C-terminal domain-containing protein n=1 Tax=Oryzias latipes TaxID=8090 RepID=A0A3P9KPT0_ORYLA